MFKTVAYRSEGVRYYDCVDAENLSLRHISAAVTMVWSYIGELVFNMLVLVGAVKMADRVVRERMRCV